MTSSMPQQIRQLVFQGTHSSWMLACHVCAVILAIILILLISRDERKLVSRAIGFNLLALRLAVLAVILLTLLQPTLTWTFEQKQSARILVGIDLSGSMLTVDQHASPAEKLRVARGLELIGNADNADRLDRWQKAFDAGQEPDWVDAAETDDEDRRAALATSRRENLYSIFEDVTKLSRMEIGRRLLTATKQPLLEQLRQICRVDLYVFAGKVQTIEGEAMSTVIAEPPESLSTNVTDLSVGLQPGINSSGEVLGTIVLTDGRDHLQQNLLGIAATLKSVNSPIYPVMIGSSYRPKDLSIQMLDYPQSVYKGDHPQLKVTLGTFGFDGKTIDVELVPEDEPDAEPVRQAVKCTGTSATVEFRLDAETLGRKSFVVRTPVLDGETHDDNNSKAFTFNVVDDRAKVLLVDGEARWEFRYLDNALVRDERIDLTHVVFDQPYLGVLPEPFFPRQLNLADQPADDATLLDGLDLIIVGDVSPLQVTDEIWQRILKFVSEGGTLVLSAGKRYMPVEHRSAALDQLLPISRPTPFSLADKAEESSPRTRGLPLQLNADGEQQPMLQFAADLPQNVAIWKSLPGQMWAMLGEAKPNATVWATTLIPAGRVEGLAVDRRFGVLVHQFVGSGQVLWVGIDGTWRWRYRVGDKYHHRFWAQLARWAAANKMSAGTNFVRFGVGKTELETGQMTSVRARWTPQFLTKFPRMKSRVEVFKRDAGNDKPFSIVQLDAVQGQPLLYEGRIVSLPAGEYLLRLAADQAELGDKPIETTLVVHDKPSVEFTDVSANKELLSKIADASGGRLFLPDEAHQLPQMFQKVDETISEYHEVSLWDRWPWLIIVFALMMTEWVIRKLNGLP